VQDGCGGILPSGFRTARVRVAFESLQDRLTDIRCLARGVAHQPTIIDVTAPAVALGRGTTVEARDFDPSRHEFVLDVPSPGQEQQPVTVHGTARRVGADLWSVRFAIPTAVTGAVGEMSILERSSGRRLDVASVAVDRS
jgi:hypothetical protein